MTRARRATGVAAAALLLVAGTSCASDSSDPAVSGTPSPTSPATATATATPPSQNEVASAAASALVKKYYATVDKLGQRSNVPLSELSTIATSVQLSALQTLLRSQREKEQRQTGDTQIAVLKVQSVNLDNSDPKAGTVPTVQVDVCWNVNKVDVVDAGGKSIVSSSRPDRGWTRLTVANYHYATNPSAGWRIATGQDLKREPCAAS